MRLREKSEKCEKIRLLAREKIGKREKILLSVREKIKRIAVGALIFSQIFLGSDAVLHNFAPREFSVATARAGDFPDSPLAPNDSANSETDLPNSPISAQKQTQSSDSNSNSPISCGENSEIIYFPGINSDANVANPMWNSYVKYFAARATEVKILNYNGGEKFDADFVADESAQVLRQSLDEIAQKSAEENPESDEISAKSREKSDEISAQKPKLTVVASSMGGLVLAKTLARGNFTDAELAQMNLILDDAPAGAATLKPEFDEIAQIYYPGPMQSAVFAGAYQHYFFANQPASSYNWQNFVDELRFLRAPIADSPALDKFASASYIQNNSAKDDAVLQPTAREIWQNKIPNLQIVNVDALHTDFAGSPQEYSAAFDEIFDEIC